MRRNFNPRGGQTWQPSPRMSGGRPSMVVDLGLQDIDKELELLQRKREIIEQQQQILSTEFRGRNEYETSYRQSSRFDDFASSYNDRRDYSAPTRKRPIPVWEDEVPNKRFSSGPERSRPRPFVRPTPPPLMRSGPVFQPQPRPVRPSGPFRPKTQKKNPPQTVKAPPPASKPKPTERKVPEPVAKPLPSDEQNRLFPDREPTKQMRGRLELALGCIIKQIREVEPNKLKAPAVIRDVKSVIRDRIREIMMGRVVGTSDSIIARYREVHDKQTDAELVDNAVNAQSGDVAPFKLEDPEKYFKVNMQRLMHFKLKKLLDQLEEVARAEYQTDNEKKNESDTPEASEPVQAPAETNIDAEKPLDESIMNTEKFKTLERWMTGKMTAMIKKYLPFFIKLMDIDAKYARLKNLITADTVKMLVEKDGQQINEMIEGAVNGSKTVQTPNKTLPYYAKLMGKPGLPRRNHMEQFFERFSPKSIKKHRTLHNLLFVGFDEKEFFDQFLAADGTVIGKHTLSIRVSDRARTESSQPKPELNSSISSEEKLIGSELDDQITDLLTSIRKAEEDTDVKPREDTDVKPRVDTDVKPGEDSDVKSEEDTDVKPEEDVETKADDDKTQVAESIVSDVKTDDDINTDGNEVKTEEIKKENDNPASDNGENTEKVEKNEANAEENVKESSENSSGEIKQDNGVEAMEKADQIKPLLDDKPTGRSTPTRASSRIAATPSRIQTRRASRLAQNDA